jgi:hypothetical protein
VNITVGRLLVILLVALAAVVSVIVFMTRGGSESNRSGSGTATTTRVKHSPDELRTAYTTYWNALTKPDPGKFCSMLTDKGRKQLVKEVGSSGITENPKSCGDAVIATYALMKAFSSVPKQLVITGVSVNGNKGTVHWTSKSETSTDTGTAKLVYRDGKWLVDEESGSEQSSEQETARADIARWLSSWCSLRPGMTKVQAVAKMGDPTSSYDATEAVPQLNWGQGAFSFTAFMDTGNVITQLQADYRHLGAADKAKVRCAAVRR